MSQESKIELGPLNDALMDNVLHYDTKRVDYTINEYELTQLESIGQSFWKEVFFASIGLSVPTLINGIALHIKLNDGGTLTNEILLNYLVFGVFIVLSILSCVIWLRENNYKKSIITKIKNKPQFKVNK